jgi:site-specific DNA recombinase
VAEKKKGIKKTDSGSVRGSGDRRGVSEPALFDEEPIEDERAAAAEAAGAGAGRTAVYARVSSDQQEKEETIASQLSAIEAYAEQSGFAYENDDVYLDEGYSGKLLRRPGLDKLQDRVSEGKYERVVVWDPDRLARSYGHQILLIEDFERAGCRLLFLKRPIGEGPDEDLLLQMQGVIAQYEHAKIQERTRRGKLHRMRRGELVNGQRVFGYHYVKRKSEIPAHYEIIDTEAEVIRKIFNWYVEEGISLRQIALRLQEAGVATVRRGRWDGANIGNMLRNPIYTGTGYANKIEAVEPTQTSQTLEYRKHLKSSRRPRPREDWLPFNAPVIVDEETFELAQQRLQQNRALAARRTKHDYLLRGLLQCEHCERSVYADTQSKSYICAYSRRAFAREHGGDPCENKRRLPVHQLDQLVWMEVCKLLKKPALLKQHYPNLREKIHPRVTGGTPEKLDIKLQEIDRQISRTNNLFIRGILEPSSHEAKYKELKEKRQRLELQRDKAASEKIDEQQVEQLLTSFRRFAATMKDRLDAADFATRRSIVEQMLKRVIVGKNDITIEHIAPCKKYNLCGNLEP